ncbi:MAG: prepilin peptidase [Chloroflexi bacterium]|nr:prepilin peptidase [Chloroflexota bacterium]
MPTLVPIPFPIALVAWGGLLVMISILDFKFRRVPNVLTYPMMAVGIARAILLTDPNFLPYWGAVWILWSLRFFAGGDAKLLMGLFGLWPDIRLVGITAAVVLVTGIPYLVSSMPKIGASH